MSNALEACISIMLILRLVQMLWSLCSAFTRISHSLHLSQTRRCMHTDATKALKLGHAIVAEELRSAENTVGGQWTFLNMKQLQFWILTEDTELFRSLLKQFSTTSSALQLKSTSRFERCNSHAKFPVGFLSVSKRSLSSIQYKKRGKMKAELLVYDKQYVSRKKNAASTLLVGLWGDARKYWGSLLRTEVCLCIIDQPINQSIKNYIAPFQDPHSEVLPTQAKWKRTVFKSYWNCEQAPFKKCLQIWGKHVPGCWTKHWRAYVYTWQTLTLRIRTL